jgi:hypothetical protein
VAGGRSTLIATRLGSPLEESFLSPYGFPRDIFGAAIWQQFCNPLVGPRSKCAQPLEEGAM